LRNPGKGKSELDAWFTSEVLPLQPMLARFLRQNWRDVAEVSDLLQETFVRIYTAASRERPMNVKPFMFSIAKNLLIDRLRRANTVPIQTMADFERLNVLDNTPDPEQQTSTREELRLLEQAIDTLPKRCRDVLVLRKIEGLSQREVAKILGITEHVVEHQMSAALNKLAEALQIDQVLGSGQPGRSANQVRVSSE